MRHVVFASALAALVAAPALADEPTRLMVMDFGANGVPESTAVTVTELVAVELSRYRALDVASGADVRKLLEVEAAREVTQCEDETSCMVMVADALGAELIVHGKVASLGSSTLVTLHLFDTGEGRSLSRASFTVKELEKLPDAVARGVGELMREPLRGRGVAIDQKGSSPSTPAPATSEAKTAAAPAAVLKDLEALSRRKAHKELLARALDIPASERSKRWEQLVAQAATETLKKASRKDPFDALKLDESLRELYPQATREAAYRKVQAGVVKKGTAACFQQNRALGRRLLRDRAAIPDCARMAETYVENVKAPAPEALELARLVKRNRHPSAAVRLYLRAAPQKGAPACSDPGLEQAVISALHEKPGSPLAEAGKTLAFERCFPQVKDALRAEFGRAANPRYFVNACPAMMKNKALGRLQTKRCKRRLKAAQGT